MGKCSPGEHSAPVRFLFVVPPSGVIPDRGDKNCETVLLYPLSYSPEEFPISHRRKVELVGLAPRRELDRCSPEFLRWAQIPTDAAIEARVALGGFPAMRQGREATAGEEPSSTS